MRYVKNGWPDYTQDVHESTLDYYSVRNMSSETGVLTYADRIVIPSNMRCDILDILHEGHVGVTK